MQQSAAFLRERGGGEGEYAQQASWVSDAVKEYRHGW
jgi:hypothetical protein